MTTKKENAPKAEQQGKTTPKKEEVKKVLPNTKQQPTVEQLQKKVEELETRLSKVPQSLDEKIEYFTEKKELIRRFGKLTAHKESLAQHLDSISEIAAKDEFENDDYYLNIETGGSYNKKSLYQLKNPVIIGDMIQFIIGRVEVKMEELRKQIEA